MPDLANVVRLPTDDIARHRLSIASAPDHATLTRIGERIKSTRGLTKVEKLDLVCRFAQRHVEIARGEVAHA